MARRGSSLLGSRLFGPPCRVAGLSSAAAGGSGRALFERSEFSPTARCEQRKVPRRGPDFGSPFLWYLSFGEAKERYSPAGARPGLLRLRNSRPKKNQISIFDPSSTTALFGKFKNSAAALALWCICANSFSRQGAMPWCRVGMTMSRERK